MSEFTVRVEESESAVFSVIAPDGKTIVHQCAADEYFYDVDAQIAANHYADKSNLQLYRDKATAQAQEIAALQARVSGLEGVAQCYRDDIKTMISGASSGWTVDRLRRYAVEVMQGIVKREGE